MSTESEQQDVLIVTGMSGAGRSTAANALEDLGWYVVDNLPPQMLRPLVDLAQRAGDTLPKIAAVVDVRGRDFFEDLGDIVRELRAGVDLRVVFLEATDAALVRRFEQVRRPHPLQGRVLSWTASRPSAPASRSFVSRPISSSTPRISTSISSPPALPNASPRPVVRVCRSR